MLPPIVVSKSQFKPKALEYLRQVEKRKQPVIITHFRKPVVTISPYAERSEDPMAFFRNTITHYDDPDEPVGLEDWEMLP